ncbi:MAG TPA: PA0069 family radical SAM protein [Candidatus Synoicihabitans sp.]|nr:PA0069 family radical SAM protein [Candidatus Synoicihabitans sp.]
MQSPLPWLRLSATAASSRPAMAAPARSPVFGPDRPLANPPLPGRGAQLNPPNRYAKVHAVPDLDATAADLGDDPDNPPPDPRTEFYDDATETILSVNESPDVPFRYGINPYRGCEHGCAYCYARAYHDYLGWSSGLDFETKIMIKRRAPTLLRRELSSPRWQPQVIAMSGATDCYQPAERRFRLTRQCLEVLLELRNPVGVITKNFLVTRDVDLFAQFATWNGVMVNLTITSLDADLAGALEPRAARPEARLRAIRLLADAGVPVGVMIAPVIPGLTEHELPAILDAAAKAGASSAGYLVLRLPHAVKEVFTTWLETHAPTKKERILTRLRDMSGGKLCSSEWGKRFTGEGAYAAQLAELFKVARRRAGLDHPRPELSTAHFRRPGGEQLALF